MPAVWAKIFTIARLVEKKGVKYGLRALAQLRQSGNIRVGRLKHLITHPEEWPHLGKEGRRIIKDRHNVSLLNKRLVENYTQLAYANALRN